MLFIPWGKGTGVHANGNVMNEDMKVFLYRELNPCCLGENQDS